MLIAQLKSRLIQGLIQVCFAAKICMSNEHCRTLKICRDIGNIWSYWINRQSPILYKGLQRKQHRKFRSPMGIMIERFILSPVWVAFNQKLHHVESFILPYMNICDVFVFDYRRKVPCYKYIVKRILHEDKSGEQVNRLTEHGDHPLVVATVYRDEDIVRILLKDHRVHRNVPRKLNALTALMSAAVDNRISITKQLLADDYVDVNMRNEAGNTALMHATSRDNSQVLRLYIHNPRVDMNVQNSCGHTALMIATSFQRWKAMKVLLLDPRVDLNIQGSVSLRTTSSRSVMHGEELIHTIPASRRPGVIPMWCSGWTALMMAAVSSNMTVLKLLYEDLRSDLNIQCDNGWTALMHACRVGNITVVKFFLKGSRSREMNVNLQNHDGYTALMIACRRGYISIMRLLLKDDRVYVNLSSSAGQASSIGQATSAGQSSSAGQTSTRQASSAGQSSSAGQASSIGQTSTRQAVSGQSPSVVTGKDVSGLTALMIACIQNYTDIVSMLLKDVRVDVNYQSNMNSILSQVDRNHVTMESNKGMTVLMHCCWQRDCRTEASLRKQMCTQNSLKILKLLIGCKRVNVNIRDDIGRPALIIATRCRDAVGLQLLLGRKDLDINAKDGNGLTALMIACDHGYVDIVEILLGSYSTRGRLEVNMLSSKGHTALMHACSNNRASVVELLLQDQNVDVNFKTRAGQTALMFACANHHVDVVRRLILDRHVDVTCKLTHNGWTALDIARHNKCSDIVEILEQTNQVRTCQ